MSTVRNQSFFKVFVLEHSVHRMKIPSPYQKHVRGKKSGTVYLRGPSGNRWSVELIEQSGELYFARGWPKFIKDHGIQEWHFLVFKFDGNQTFKVKIYSPTGCEEKAALTAKPSQGGDSTPHKHVEVKVEDDAENRAGSGLLPGPSARAYPYFMVQLKGHSVRNPNQGMVLVSLASHFELLKRGFRAHFSKPTCPILCGPRLFVSNGRTRNGQQACLAGRGALTYVRDGGSSWGRAKCKKGTVARSSSWVDTPCVCIPLTALRMKSSLVCYESEVSGMLWFKHYLRWH